MRIELRRPSELSAADRQLWLSWQGADARLASPFLCPAFVDMAAEVRPDARVAVVHQGADVVGFWPLSVDRLGAAGPAVPRWTDCQGMIPRPGWAFSWADVLSAARLTGWRFDHLVAHQAPALPRPPRIGSSPVMDLSHGWEAYDEWLGTEHRRMIQRKRSRFRRAEREHDMQFLERDPDPDALTALIRMKSEQCRDRGWAQLFDDPSATDLVERAACRRGHGMTGFVSTLRLDGDIAAAALFLDSTDTRALWITAFAAQWSSYSPGIMLMLRAAEGAARQGLRRLSFGKGDEEFKRTLSQDAEHLASGTLSGSGPGGTLFAARVAPARAAEAVFGRSATAELTVRKAVRRARRVSYHRSRAPYTPSRPT